MADVSSYVPAGTEPENFDNWSTEDHPTTTDVWPLFDLGNVVTSPRIEPRIPSEREITFEE